MPNAEKLYTTLCGIFCLYNNFVSLGRYIWCCEIKWPLIKKKKKKRIGE